ncbi:MAG: DUF4249 domain-containing protein [Saprospiraceae bacterium]|nr:DUF4249 domain-containing protein [Saprospiraceae bacterium]
MKPELIRLSVILVLTWLISCAREIQIDLPEEPEKIVAVSHFTTGEPIRTRLTLSRPTYAAGQPEVLENASVSVFRDDQLLENLVFDKDLKYWQGQIPAENGVDYRLYVQADGLPDASSASSIPEQVSLMPLQVDWANIRIVGWDSLRQALRLPLVLKPSVMPGQNRFFAFALKHEIEVFKVVNGQQVPDYFYEGSSAFLTDGPTLALLHNIPEPVILVDEKFWDDDRDAIRLDALIPFNPETEKPRRILIEWRTLSGEFYRYHLSLARQGNNLPLSDPDAVYNNIVGGYGNFSGYSVDIEALDLQF